MTAACMMRNMQWVPAMLGRYAWRFMCRWSAVLHPGWLTWTRTMSTFLRLPATLVISGSFTCVHKKVEWLIVKPSTALDASTICNRESRKLD